MLGAEVVAEGIEEPEDYHLLLELGVKLGQGYLFGKPKRVEMPDRPSNGALPRVDQLPPSAHEAGA